MTMILNSAETNSVIPKLHTAVFKQANGNVSIVVGKGYARDVYKFLEKECPDNKGYISLDDEKGENIRFNDVYIHFSNSYSANILDSDYVVFEFVFV